MRLNPIFTKSALLIFLLFVAFITSAQTFHASVIGGLNFCQIDGDRFAGYNKLGFNGGIRIHTEKDEKWDIGFDLLYTTKGSKKRIIPDDPNPQIFIIKAQYVELPLWARYKIPSLSNLRAIGGISIGSNVGGTVDDGYGPKDANFKPLEVALNLGAEYKLAEALTLSLRHSNSMNRIGEDYPGARRWVNRVGLFNRIYMLSLAYELNS